MSSASLKQPGKFKKKYESQENLSAGKSSVPFGAWSKYMFFFEVNVCEVSETQQIVWIILETSAELIFLCGKFRQLFSKWATLIGYGKKSPPKEAQKKRWSNTG